MSFLLLLLILTPPKWYNSKIIFVIIPRLKHLKSYLLVGNKNDSKYQSAIPFLYYNHSVIVLPLKIFIRAGNLPSECYFTTCILHHSIFSVPTSAYTNITNYFILIIQKIVLHQNISSDQNFQIQH